MVKYATALKLGAAESKRILRRQELGIAIRFGPYCSSMRHIISAQAKKDQLQG